MVLSSELILQLLLTVVISGAAAGPCALPNNLQGIAFDPSNLAPEQACLASSVIVDPATAGRHGPVATPISRDIYDFLLDNLEAAAKLVQVYRLKDRFIFEKRRAGEWFADDHDRTQGTLKLLWKSPRQRLYYFEGRHSEAIYRNVPVRAVVLMTLEERDRTIESTLAVYTKVDDAFVRGVIRIFQSLADRVVTRKASKGIRVSTQLAGRIAGAPETALRALPDLPLSEPDRRRFEAMLRRIATSVP